MSIHLFRNAAASIALDVILSAEAAPEPSTLATSTDTPASIPHGVAFLGVVRGLHVAGMSPLDIILMIPTIVQLIQQLAADVAAVIAAIQKLKAGG